MSLKFDVKYQAALLGLCLMGSVILGFSTADWTKWLNVGFMCFAIFFLVLVSFELAETRSKLAMKIKEFDNEMNRIKEREKRLHHD